MLSLDAVRLETMVEEGRLDEAARAINDRYREVSGKVLDVFEDLLAALVTASFRGDLQNLAHLLRIGSPSGRSNLRDFLGRRQVQNCLSSVLASLEKEMPAAVIMGFTGVSAFFRSSDFASTYSADILNYEPELSRLTDQRLERLLSLPPNALDISLLDMAESEKQREVLETFRKESLDSIGRTFRETAKRCFDFLGHLEDLAVDFRRFFEEFRRSSFVAVESTLAEWASLGEEYFHTEQTKSSLMLPISPRALYWGMQEEYPETLARLKELKAMVTPDFLLSGPRSEGEAWVVGIECLNPGALKGEGFVIEPLLRYFTREIADEEVYRAVLVPREPHRRYEYRVEHPPESRGPLFLTMRVSCEARFYRAPFTLERQIVLESPS